MTLGTPKETSNGLELPAICPFHEDRYMGNFYINLNSGLYHCFSCHAKGIIYELPLKNGVSIGEFRNAWNAVKTSEKLTDFRLSPDLVKYYRKQPYSGYAYSERRINGPTQELYGVFEDSNSNPIFFVRGWDGDVQALWIRNDDQYYLLEPLDSKRRGHIFGLNLPPTDKYILTEGFFDAMSVYQDTGYKVVSACGVFPTAKQIENLKKLEPLYIMFDGDTAGRRGRNRLFELMSDVEVYFCGGFRGDPDELTKEQKIDVLGHAKSRTEYSEIYAKNSN